MKVEVLRGFCLGGGADAFPGDEVEVSDKEAARLIAQGKVRHIQDGAAKDEAGKPDATPGAVQNGDPKPVHSDPAAANQAGRQPGRPPKAKAK